MTKVAHTPGPWSVGGISMDTGSISIRSNALRIVIADVTNAASFGDFLSGAMKRGGGGFEQSDARTQFANAHLIAAAPDLLAALIGVVAVADRATVEFDRARAAIARATGQPTRIEPVED